MHTKIPLEIYDLGSKEFYDVGLTWKDVILIITSVPSIHLFKRRNKFLTLYHAGYQLLWTWNRPFNYRDWRMRYIGYKVLLDVWTQRKVVLLERVSLQEKQSYIILKRGKVSNFMKKLEFMQNAIWVRNTSS